MIAIVKPTQEEHKLIMDFFPTRLPEVLDWSIIMQIVEKIESLETEFDGRFGVYISSNSCTIQGTLFDSRRETFKPAYWYEVVLETKIESVYHSCITFIKFWNQYHKK